jgi:hypothetical protein
MILNASPILQTVRDVSGCSSTLLLLRCREYLGAQIKHGQRARNLDSLTDLDDRKIPVRNLVSEYPQERKNRERVTHQPQHMPTNPKPPATLNNSKM